MPRERPKKQQQQQQKTKRQKKKKKLRPNVFLMLMLKQSYRFPLNAAELFIITQFTLGWVIKFKSGDTNSNSPSQINPNQTKNKTIFSYCFHWGWVFLGFGNSSTAGKGGILKLLSPSHLWATSGCILAGSVLCQHLSRSIIHTGGPNPRGISRCRHPA